MLIAEVREMQSQSGSDVEEWTELANSSLATEHLVVWGVVDVGGLVSCRVIEVRDLTEAASVLLFICFFLWVLLNFSSRAIVLAVSIFGTSGCLVSFGTGLGSWTGWHLSQG